MAYTNKTNPQAVTLYNIYRETPPASRNSSLAVTYFRAYEIADAPKEKQAALIKRLRPHHAYRDHGAWWAGIDNRKAN